jgi:peroxiredoxin-like protein
MTHLYPVHVEWVGGRDGQGTVGLVKATHNTPLAVPTEFHGSGVGTSPEELLAAAIGACYAATFGIVAEHRKVPVAALDVNAIGQVEQDGPKLTYTGITLKVRLRMAPGTSEEQRQQAIELAMRADKYCVVTNAVRSSLEVRVEPEIVADTEIA